MVLPILTACDLQEEEMAHSELTIGRAARDAILTHSAHAENELESCVRILDINPRAASLGPSLVEILRIPDLSADQLLRARRTALRWAESNWRHDWSSSVLERVVQGRPLEPGDTTRWLKLVSRRLKELPPGVNSGRRNRTLRKLLEHLGGVQDEALVELARVVSSTTALSPGFLSRELMQRLAQELASDDPARANLLSGSPSLPRAKAS